MLDIKFIRENSEAVRTAGRNKRINFDLDRLLDLDKQIRPKQVELETLQSDRNRISKDIGKAAPDARDAMKAQVQDIKQKMEGLEAELKELKVTFDELMFLVPNPPRADVPVGKDDSENVEVRKVGTPRQFTGKPLDHVEIGKRLGILDLDRGVKIAGSRSYVLKGDGAMLEQAIMRHTLEKLVRKGYTAMSIPVLVNESAMVGTGYFPTGREQAYLCERDNMALVGTAEVSLTSYYSDEILDEKDLPIRLVAQSNCFRREAGTYGKDTHGLYRVHQFQKIEQVIVAPADPAASEKLHDELLGNAEEVLRDLGLAYRVVYVCTGDLGQGQLRKHDIETWMPSRGSYSETHSCSTFHDFQARRLKLRYRDAAGKVHTCFTLNNTAIASPRVLIPLLETHQTDDGRVAIPECLQGLMGGKTHISKN